MSGANYEYCPVCDRKALYVGDEDIPDGTVVLHKACADQERSRAVAAAAAAERERIRQLADSLGAGYEERQPCSCGGKLCRGILIRAHAPFADLIGDDDA